MLNRRFLGMTIFIVCSVYFFRELMVLGRYYPYNLTMTTNIGNSIGQHNHDDFVSVLSPHRNFIAKNGKSVDMPLLDCLPKAAELMNDSIQIVLSNNFHKKYSNFFVEYCCKSVLYGNFCTTFSEQGKQQYFKSQKQITAEEMKAINERFERIVNE